MQKVLLLHYVFTCRLPKSGHLILMSESCLVPPIQPFPFTRTYLRAYNVVKRFLVNTIYYNTMYHYRNDKYTLKIVQNAQKMQNVCVLSALQRTCFGSMSHMCHC